VTAGDFHDLVDIIYQISTRKAELGGEKDSKDNFVDVIMIQ